MEAGIYLRALILQKGKDMRYTGGVHLVKPQDGGVFECFYDEKGRMEGGFLCICSNVCHIKNGEDLCGYVVRRLQEEVRMALRAAGNEERSGLQARIKRKLESSRKEIRSVVSCQQGYCAGAVWMADECYMFAEGGIGIFGINSLYGRKHIVEIYSGNKKFWSSDVKMQGRTGVFMVNPKQLPVLWETEAAGCLLGGRRGEEEDTARRIREVGCLLEESIGLLIVEEWEDVRR